MEPRKKNSPEWRDWFVRHQFGGMTVASIKQADKKELEIMQLFLKDVIDEKEKN